MNDRGVFTHCHGSGRRGLEGLVDQHNQQCPVCLYPNWLTPGGYHHTHQRLLLDDELCVWSQVKREWVKP